MGVWHLSGLGINPGSITVPLTYIYLLLKQAAQKDPAAQKFFRSSGEPAQKLKGAPEALIIFTSKEVINGDKQNEIIDKWYHTHKKESAPETMKAYLAKLLKELKDGSFTEFYDKTWLKYFYCVEVNHQDFDDCFSKIAITVNALKDKEIWINMIGGTNQINSALLSSSGFTSTAGVYYYIYQTNVKLLHPEIEKPYFGGLRIPVPPHSWHALPVFTLDMSALYRKLKELFQSSQKVNVNQIKLILKELNFPEQFFAKLRGTLIEVEGDIATKGYMLDYWVNRWKNLEEASATIRNFSEWKNWASSKGILKEIEPY